MAAVQWETVPQQTYDDMVAVLLNTLHPDAERLDGRGGDGGRDIQLRRDGRLDLFELKSFTGRLGKEQGRRAQVERSLKRAAQLDPDSWTLVVPIDHTKGELAWFDGLRGRYGFPLIWRGRTWLDQQMAAHPAIPCYYLEGGDSHVVRVLRELQQEQADLVGGIPDALQRLQVLGQRIDELSPHYRLDIAMSGDTIAMALRPRYRGAERDHPILFTGTFTFPDTPTGREAEQRLERAFNYGDEVVIEPDNVRDLHVDLAAGWGEEVTNPKIILGPAEDPAFRLDGRATISDPAALLHPGVPQPDGRLLYALLTGHPDRTPGQLVFLADLTVELRAWPTDTWTKVGVDPQAATGAVIVAWRGGHLKGLRLDGLTAEESLAVERPAMTYLRARLADRLDRRIARAHRR
jgi:hypothetical protein